MVQLLGRELLHNNCYYVRVQLRIQSDMEIPAAVRSSLETESTCLCAHGDCPVSLFQRLMALQTQAIGSLIAPEVGNSKVANGGTQTPRAPELEASNEAESPGFESSPASTSAAEATLERELAGCLCVRLDSVSVLDANTWFIAVTSCFLSQCIGRAGAGRPPTRV